MASRLPSVNKESLARLHDEALLDLWLGLPQSDTARPALRREVLRRMHTPHIVVYKHARKRTPKPK